MKTILILILATIPAFAETVTLTDTKGRTMPCKIISSNVDRVSVENAEGKTFDIELSRLDEPSQKIVADFVVEAKATAEAAKRIVVESITVKKVDGKFRYFFVYRNNTGEPWEGKISVNLVNASNMKGMGEVLTSTEPMAPGGGGTFFIEASVGPPRVHGDYGHVAYSYDVTSKDGKKFPKIVTKLSGKESGF